MAKSLGLRKFFQQAKKTVPVKLGNKIMQFTTTQAMRLGELADLRRDKDGVRSGFDQLQYTLEDAAFRLLISEDEVISKALDRALSLYVSIADIPGIWMCKTTHGEVLKSAEQTCISGFLALIDKDLRTLASSGVCDVNILEMRLPPDPTVAAIPKSVSAALAAWGDGMKVFRLSRPMRVDRTKIRLMAPLLRQDSH